MSGETSMGILSVKWHLWQWLHAAIVQSALFSRLKRELPSFWGEFPVPQGLPAHWLKDTTISYGCVLPLLGSRVLGQNVEAGTAEFVEVLRTFAATIPQDSYLQNLTIEGFSSGWIHLSLSPIGLAIWLNHCQQICKITDRCQGLSDLSPQLVIPLNSSQLNLISLGQYSHARCGALLRLAQQQGWEGTEISWLTPEGTLRSSQDSEWQLIFQLMQVADIIATATTTQILQQVRLLSQAFDQFDRQCRIFGQSDPALSQTRLGLVRITQAWLRSLLTQGLQHIAPAEL